MNEGIIETESAANKRKRLSIRYLLLIAILITFLPLSLATAEYVQLAWDSVNDQRVGAYEVHYGDTSRGYQQKVDATATTATVNSLLPGKTYYFAVRACTTDRSVCSGFSNEVSTSIPSAPTQTPAPIANFSASPRSGYAPLTVVLNDASTGQITQRNWQLGDGKTAAGSQVVHSYGTPGTYTVRLSVTGPGGSDEEVKQGYIQVAAQPVPDPPPPSDPGDGDYLSVDKVEVGELTLTHVWQWVSFDHQIQDPVVVVNPLSHNGRDPATVVVDGVDTTGFWVRIKEWEYLNGTHPEERVSYIAVERGRHQLAQGVWLEAGRFDSASTASYQRANFASAFATVPVVLTTVSSTNDKAAAVTQIRDVAEGGFRLRLRRQEADKTEHSVESVDYIAVQVGSGSLGGARFQVGRTGTEVNHSPYLLSFKTSFPTPPFFVADFQTTNGGDPASLRWQNLSTNQVNVFVNEEQSSDSEVFHTRESVGYFVIERR